MITYFLAPSSPWTYLGHARLVEMADRYQVPVQVLPVDFGVVFSATGGLPLAQRPPARQAYRLIELARWRDALGVAMQIKPKFFPVAADPAALAIHATSVQHGSSKALALSGKVLQACWEREMDIAAAPTLAQLSQEIGVDYASLDLAGAKTPYAKATELALQSGVFGAPWYVLDGEPFWGQDRLEFLESALKRRKAAQ